jgi:hypothetical protein
VRGSLRTVFHFAALVAGFAFYSLLFALCLRIHRSPLLYVPLAGPSALL